jgi:diguanylate cyclase (GGDEF)-like protein
MTTSGELSLVRRSAVYGYSIVLALLGTALVWLSGGRPPTPGLPFRLEWWALLPVYVVVLQVPLQYEFRQHARMSTLTQIPMVFGLVFLAPWAHLMARFVAAIVDVPLQRRPPMKAFYNVALSAVEIGLLTSVFSLLGSTIQPGPALWTAILCAVVAQDLICCVVIMGVLALVQVPQSFTDLRDNLASAVATSVIFTSLGIVAVAASWTDLATLGIVGLLALGLALGFHRHRRLTQETRQQQDLQTFLKGLGPIDLDDRESEAVLENVRVLMHAEFLDLAWLDGASWRQVSLGSSQGSMQYLESATPLTTEPQAGSDRISRTLTGSRDLLGVLTVRERMGRVRPFGVRDHQMMETVASELAGALERGQLQRALALAATTDPLTNLPNLNATSRELDRLLESGRGYIVAAVAVDSFREVNDTLGHEVGDELLLEVTRRLKVAYHSALIGRIGGGRFAIAVDADSVGNDPSMFGLGLRAQIEGGAQLGPVGTHIRLSVGCVRAPEHGDDAATLVRRAETAMYGARHAHGGPVVWEPVYEIEGQRRLAVVMALREALSSGAIGVAFQPKLDAKTLQVTGVEALARWTHPALGAISPGEFIPLAEAAGLMGPLTSSVLRQAVTACKGWQRRGGRIGVAVNVSADSVLDPAFVTEIAAILTSINISPDLLTLELTEGVVVDDPALAAERMKEIRALGVKISGDDFGTGYSSLTYLKGLPVDEVKVDKGFVDDIVHDEADRAVVRAVVDIAHTMGLKVVAEGVEHVDQSELLAALGVDEVQGYLHARPMPALDVAQWLRRREQPMPASYLDNLPQQS